MSKLSKLFRGMMLLIRKPYLINNILNEQEVYNKKVIKKFNLPDGLPQINIKYLLPDAAIEVYPFAFLEGGSLPTDLALLKALAIKYDVQNYLEIGTWRGESAANVSSVVGNCYTINLPDKDMLKMGLKKEYVQSHRFFSETLKNVKHIEAHSHYFDFKTLEKKFDMVFIDGDHHYEAVKQDTQTAFEIIKDENSIIVWHDYASTPEAIRWDVFKGILDGCPPDKRKHLYHVSNTLCAVYLKNTFPTQNMNAYALPDKSFKISLEIIS